MEDFKSNRLLKFGALFMGVWNKIKISCASIRREHRQDPVVYHCDQFSCISFRNNKQSGLINQQNDIFFYFQYEKSYFTLLFWITDYWHTMAISLILCIILIRDMIVKFWNRQHHGQAIHPIENNNEFVQNSLHDYFLPPRLWRLLEAKTL